MRWIRIWTKETFSGTTFQELNAEQRGIWFSLLVMAGLDIQPQQGEVALREGIGYDTQTLAKLLDCKPKILKKTLEILQKFEKIELKNSKNLKNGAIIIIKNWSKYQTEYAHYRREKPKNLDNSLDNSLDTHPRQIKNKIQNKNIPPIPPKQVGGLLTQDEKVFETARKEYPGTKRGLETEFTNFRKKHKDWKQVITLLSPAIRKQIDLRTRLKEQNKFVPEWKHFQTWINQRCWEEETEMPRSEWDDIPEITD